MSHKLILPGRIEKNIRNYSWERIYIGMSGALTYRIKKNNEVEMYLKIGEHSALPTVKREFEVLRWLQHKLPVPQIIDFEEDENRYYLVTTAVKGLLPFKARSGGNLNFLISMLSDTTNMIKGIDISGCPFIYGVDEKLKDARKRFESGLVHTKRFYPITSQPGLNRILTNLEKIRPAEDNLVFSHGDLVLQNIIVKDRKTAGVIDWGRGGIADFYQDISILGYSIRIEYGKRIERIFYRECGIDVADTMKIRYYKNIDSFF
jgi:aminoglycoside phosphotransferase